MIIILRPGFKLSTPITSSWSSQWLIWYNKINMREFLIKALMCIWQCFSKFVILSKWMVLIKMLFEWDCSYCPSSTRHVVGFNQCHQVALTLGRNWCRNFSLSFFHHQSFLNHRVKSLNFISSISIFFMTRGSNSRILFENALNMTIKIGSRLNYSTMGWMEN